jgi:O-antigen/teichoic acid export membrane protein
MNQASSADTFSGRVVVLFGTQVFGAAVGIVNGILLARLLGPAAKGDYYILIILPATTMVLIQLGLPQAFGFFAARGQTVGIVIKAMVLTAVLSLSAFVGLIVFLPVIRTAFLHAIPLDLILFAFLALPLALNATFTSGIVMGRQAVRWYAAVNMAYPIATTALLIVILGGIGPSVGAAIAVYLIASSIQTVGFAVGAWRVSASTTQTAGPVSYRELFRYGLPFFPGSLTQFFSARADVYLIAYLIPDPSAPLGYYSMAVGLAELVFFFPNAVATLYFPHVAGSAREDSDRQVAMVSRVALLITAAVAVALVPASVLMIQILLPLYAPALPALFVLLPGVVALSTTKIVYGYVTGIRMPAITSYVNIFAFIINIVANLILIPRFGIVGASAASLISYTLSSVIFTTIAARLANARVLDFWIPRPSDIRFITATTIGLVRRVRRAALGGT